MDVLKEKHLEKNMTLEDVGKLVGVGKSTVRKWENGMIENMGRDKIGFPSFTILNVCVSTSIIELSKSPKSIVSLRVLI
ncbi:helix-turn-helix transcriptional regulator [Enterococcus hirae]|nr:helix-turn-helix transcriptional regulator [Enterococcus hirae]